MRFECLFLKLTTILSPLLRLLNVRICDRKLPGFSLTFETFPTLALILKLMNLLLPQVLNPFLYIRIAKLFPHTNPVSSTSEAGNTEVQKHGSLNRVKRNRSLGLPGTLGRWRRALKQHSNE